jgi:alcohol dehydrogenase class IV
MNGFDKGIEAVYGRAASPLTDATAVRGLDHLRRGLVGAGDDPAATEHATLGALLVGYGLSTAGPSKLGPIHAFGHGLSRGWPLQQGVAHAVVAPRVVDAALAAATDDRPLAELATGLGVAADRASVVAAVRELRDALDLPTRLRDTDGPARDELDDVAAAVRADPLVHRGPAGYEPTVAQLRDLLVAAW